MGVPLEVRGRVVRHTRRLTFAEGELLDAAGVVLASATGKFVGMPDAESRAVADSLLYLPGDWRPGSGAD